MTTPSGGHLGWIAGSGAPFGEPWTDPLVVDYVRAVVALTAEKGEKGAAAHSGAQGLSALATVTAGAMLAPKQAAALQ